MPINRILSKAETFYRGGVSFPFTLVGAGANPPDVAGEDFVANSIEITRFGPGDYDIDLTQLITGDTNLHFSVTIAGLGLGAYGTQIGGPGPRPAIVKLRVFTTTAAVFADPIVGVPIFCTVALTKSAL